MKQHWVTGAVAFGLAAGASVAVGAPGSSSYQKGMRDALRNDPANFSLNRIAAAAMSDRSLLERNAQRAALVAAYRGPNGHASSFDSKLGVPTFLWSGLDRAPSSVMFKADRMVEMRARDFLSRRAQALGLDTETLGGAVLSEAHDTGRGPSIARFSQRSGGVEVFGSQLNVMMDRSGGLVAISGHFTPDMDLRATPTASFGASASLAIGKAFSDLGGKVSGSFAAGERHGDYTQYSRPAASSDLTLQQDPRAKRVYYPKGQELIPAYYLELSAATRDGGTQRDYGYVVAADGSEILFRKNLTAYESFSYRVWADADNVGTPFDAPIGNGFAPYAGGTLPVAGAPTNLVALEASSDLPTGDPWLPAGATESVGNNTDAYVDIAGFDGLQTRAGDFRAPVSSAGVFDYTYVPYADPSTTEARNAAITNLFYLNNWLHDTWYPHGFDEAAGNAQTDNFGRGGVDGDPIHAEGQDKSGTNNANMRTPADGGTPRMQMYLWSGPISGEFTVNSPASIAGDKEFNVASFGPQEFDLSGNIVVATDGTAPTTDLCEDLTNASAISGKIAIIDRGTCSFESKVQKVEEAGAIAAIIVNNQPSGTITMGEDTAAGVDANIPSMMITYDDGAAIRSAITGGATVNVHMQREEAPMLDGTVDAGVVTHEFFHYVSNRLVNNSSGLVNNQGGGMGEGWSDFDFMLLQARPEDTSIVPGYAGAYAMGAWVATSPYFGIRRAPYSTQLTINGLTFKHIQEGEPLPTDVTWSYGQDGVGNSEVHSTGEVWTSMLWQAYAYLLNDSRYTYEEAQSRMKDYIIAGLKMTPTSPTFTEARDGILAAAWATDYLDFIDLSKGFAERGIGVGAVSPDRDSADNIPVTESYVVAENTAPTADAGSDQTVNETTIDGEPTVVTLSGSGADVDSPDGLTYSWTQVSGPSVTLENADNATASFAAPNVSTETTLTFAVTVTDPVGAVATDTVAVTIIPIAHSPVVTVCCDADVAGAAQISLTGSVTDPDGDEGLSYQWSLSTGLDASLSGTDTLTPTLSVPNANGTIGVILTATDADGLETSSAVTITAHYVDTPPVLNVPSALNVAAGSEVAITADASDPDGTSLEYRWSQISGEGVDLTGATSDKIVFTAPSLTEASVVTFKITVTDETGSSTSATVVVNVAAVTNLPPDVYAGAPITAAEGTLVTLSGVASDPDEGDSLNYSWTQTSGPAVTLTGADTLTPTFTAPEVAEDTVLHFTLEVTDPSGAAVSDAVEVTVTNVVEEDNGGGSGSFGWLTLGGLLLPALMRRRRSLPQ